MPGDSKTEKATPKKRKDERKKGNVFMSRDAVAVASLLLGFFLLKSWIPTMARGLSEFLTFCLEASMKPMTVMGDPEAFTKFLVTLLKTAGPLLAAAILAAIVATFAQTRMLVSFSSLKPKFSRMNPLEGIKKLFSMRSLVEVFKGTLKISLLLIIIYNFLKGAIGEFPNYLGMDLVNSAQYLMGRTFTMVMQIAMAFTALSAFDFIYQWWDYERKMKMSKQEVKEEFKQMEGDPQVKGKIKEIQRKMAQSRMMQQVPSADVVIRNPTHFAVALRYDPQKDPAPIVVAMGQDSMALRIVAVAEENNVVVVEDKPLARSLYAQADLGREIPAELYGAVAEVLVYLYKLNHKL